VTRIVIMGGGPGGYEAALVAVQYGADVTVIERDGLGGACVLSDCVPSKTFIASAGGRPRYWTPPAWGSPSIRSRSGSTSRQCTAG
jgi:pyruvate/2-oxoglutarate dehydrogenase complex dihydrolipoamide dehydrogenase (E3) component